MHSATIQSRIWKGYGKSAEILGESYAFYHAGTALEILDESGNPILDEAGRPLLDESAGTINPLTGPYANLFVSLNAEDMKYGKPNKYGKATWYALFDAKNANVGDYLVGGQGTFFIAGLQLLLPILVVECNRTITVFRPQVQTGVGAVGYGGNTAANETTLMTGWPCSILQGTKGEKSEANFPGDVRSPWWVILLPYAGVQILPDDIITDDLGLRYAVSSTELSDLGWRITAMTAVP